MAKGPSRPKFSTVPQPRPNLVETRVVSEASLRVASGTIIQAGFESNAPTDLGRDRDLYLTALRGLIQARSEVAASPRNAAQFWEKSAESNEKAQLTYAGCAAGAPARHNEGPERKTTTQTNAKFEQNLAACSGLEQCTQEPANRSEMPDDDPSLPVGPKSFRVLYEALVHLGKQGTPKWIKMTVDEAGVIWSKRLDGLTAEEAVALVVQTCLPAHEGLEVLSAAGVFNKYVIEHWRRILKVIAQTTKDHCVEVELKGRVGN